MFGSIYGALVIPRFMEFVKKANARVLVTVSTVLAIIVGADVIYGYIIKTIINGGL